MTIKTVVIDSKEPGWVQALTFDNAPVTVQHLPCGDAWLACEGATLIVERKTLPDLLASIADGRLFDQAGRMAKASQWSYVVVTELPTVRSGYIFVNGSMTKRLWCSVTGALMTVQELGVAVTWCEGDTQYAPTLTRLAKRNRGDVHVKKRRDVALQTPGELVLSSLPGISDVRARALFEHCGSAAFALQYLSGESGGSCPGVGLSTKAAARAALGLPADLRIAVIAKEEAA
jgi:ERCC4-type nuclease